MDTKAQKSPDIRLLRDKNMTLSLCRSTRL